ncbi:hypothetical protein BHE74_00045930 [Ensete ventricosum]|nr:hypothetical protein GW17_00019258 [Ensete ventricosum]RWW48040.1 hypothetical protein BHE74_00045930 [Ensete ventricosum]
MHLGIVASSPPFLFRYSCRHLPYSRASSSSLGLESREGGAGLGSRKGVKESPSSLNVATLLRCSHRRLPYSRASSSSPRSGLSSEGGAVGSRKGVEESPSLPNAAGLFHCSCRCLPYPCASSSSPRSGSLRDGVPDEDRESVWRNSRLGSFSLFFSRFSFFFLLRCFFLSLVVAWLILPGSGWSACRLIGYCKSYSKHSATL